MRSSSWLAPDGHDWLSMSDYDAAQPCELGVSLTTD